MKVLRSAAAACSLLVAAGLAAAPPSSAAPRPLTAAPLAAPVACPDALPTADAVEGLTGTGFTVSKGTTPEPFAATVLGRITDGIAPGVDMILAELDSPAVVKNGVWSGMSGSPVYTSDGRLIGAVAYGLSLSPSTIAGITPASAMRGVLARPTAAPAAASGPKKVSVPKATAAKIAATGAVTRAQAAGGFSRLPLPVTVSGLSGGSAGQTKLVDRLQAKLPGARITLGGRAASTGGSPSDITAGSNFAAALSYGLITFGGVGTTTFVCDDKAVAFGHPLLYSGRSSLSVHPASAVTVQPDVFGSYKIANLGGVVGTLDQDRLAGVRGLLGAAPSTALIRSDLTVGTADPKVLTTRLVAQQFAPDVAAFHTLASIENALDQFGEGSADVTLRVRGVRPDGRTFSLVRNDSFVDRSSLSYAVADSVYATLDAIVNQGFEKVRITSVTLTGTVSPDLEGYRVSSLKVRQAGVYVTPKDVVKAKSGGTLRMRLRLVPLAGGTGRNLDLNVPVPAGTAGSSAFAEAGTGSVYPDVSAATSFPQVLAALRAAPAGDTGRGTLFLFDSGKSSTVTVSAGAPIVQYQNGFEVTIS